MIKKPDSLSVALETNGKGFLGFLVELPGAFVRGRSEQEAVSKVRVEARTYLDWLGIAGGVLPYPRVIQRHRCALMVEDADSEILLEADQGAMTEGEFHTLLSLVVFSGRTFSRAYTNAELKDWVDSSRVRKTFHGENPSTIQMIHDHVNRTQYYYLSALAISFTKDEQKDFVKTREVCADKLEEFYRNRGNSQVFKLNGEHVEKWTLKKVLRRYIWHDRIHGRAMVRILDKQKRLGMIGSYDDPFHLQLSPSKQK